MNKDPEKIGLLYFPYTLVGYNLLWKARTVKKTSKNGALVLCEIKREFERNTFPRIKLNWHGKLLLRIVLNEGLLSFTKKPGMRQHIFTLAKETFWAWQANKNQRFSNPIPSMCDIPTFTIKINSVICIYIHVWYYMVYIYLYVPYKNQPNVREYTSPMDEYMGIARFDAFHCWTQVRNLVISEHEVSVDPSVVGKHPMIYRVFVHPRWLAGFLPSTMSNLSDFYALLGHHPSLTHAFWWPSAQIWAFWTTNCGLMGGANLGGSNNKKPMEITRLKNHQTMGKQGRLSRAALTWMSQEVSKWLVSGL